MFIFSGLKFWSARESRERFLLPTGWFPDLHTDCNYASGGRSAPLFNDFSLASLSVRLRSEVAVSQVATRNLQPLAGVVSGSAELSEKT